MIKRVVRAAGAHHPQGAPIGDPPIREVEARDNLCGILARQEELSLNDVGGYAGSFLN